MKILNLYAGIGGNRKLWKWEEITQIVAIENNKNIARIYQDFFPNDKVIICDAHKYLLEHFEEFDFIWSSPPCPSHSSFRKSFSCNVGAKPIYPDMKLYEEILLLKHYFKGKYCVENVKSFYEPFVPPQEIQRHYFWCNFHISQLKLFNKDTINLTGDEEQIKTLQKRHNIYLDEYNINKKDKRTLLRNCVTPLLGLHILNESKRDIQSDLFRK